MIFRERSRLRAFVTRARLAADSTPKLSAAYARVQASGETLILRRILAIAQLIGNTAIVLAAPFVAVFLFVRLDGYKALGADGVLVLLTLFETWLAFWYASSLLGELRVGQANRLVCYASAPLSDRRIVRSAWLALARSVAWSTYIVLFGFVAVALAEPLNFTGWILSTLFVLAHFLLTLSLTTLLVVRWPSVPGTTICVVSLGAAILLIPFYCVNGVSGWPTVARFIYAFLPAGWLNAAFSFGYLRSAPWSWSFLAPVALIIFAGEVSRRKLFATYKIHEYHLRPGFVLADSNWWQARAGSLDILLFSRFLDAEPDLPAPSFLAPPRDISRDAPATPLGSAPNLPAPPRNLSPDAAAGPILRRFHSSPPRKSALDNVVRRVLTPRECDILTFITGAGEGWTRPLASVPFMLMIAMGIVACLLPNSMFVVILTSTSLLMRWSTNCHVWVGFSAPLLGGTCVARYALAPIGFDEISKTILKIACVRAFVSLPIVLAILAVVSLITGSRDQWPTWALAGLASLLIYVVGQGWLLALRFAETMSWRNTRSNRVFPTAVRSLTSFTGFLLALLLYAFAIVFTVDWLLRRGVLSRPALPYVGLVLFIVFAISSLGIWRCVRTLYRRNLVDLIRTRPPVSKLSFQSTPYAQWSPNG
jgi:hypothetical protein